MLDIPFAPDHDPRAFRDALACFATGVTVVTIAGPDGPMGMTANSFASVSLDPPLVLWSPARSSSRFTYFTTAHFFAIHVLPADQAALCARFTRGGAGFTGLKAEISETGVPLLTDVLARFECEMHATHEGGDHMIVVGRVQKAVLRGGDPLVFANGTFGRFLTEA